ncbi:MULTISPECIES: hypothetical protein [Serratia]|uniref:Uncharacterized protein n=1 Tax=Serratia fonticola TaxID=47917 RepID=A0AAW3WKS7_SERFO|nr:hypothetical protein [Serratia fonticola]MBC3210803.1 hypothetical protein [Serratia fonticola]NYA11785.1 hypothetical protein [Serratia fonticola]NYA32653.1 hypothetical protein [Serratia fonticola]
MQINSDRTHKAHRGVNSLKVASLHTDNNTENRILPSFACFSVYASQKFTDISQSVGISLGALSLENM